MEFHEWLNSVIKSGNLCDAYKDKALDAKSKLALVRLCLDSNGASYLCEMQAKGYPLSYETICSKFRSYINSRYIAEFKNEKGNGYTSCIYCCFSDSSDINIETTITTILGCKSDIWVRENDFVRIYADSNCDLAIHCPKTSRCIVEYWDGANIRLLDCYDLKGLGNVELIKH